MNLKQRLQAMFNSYNTLFNMGIASQVLHWTQVAMEVPSSGAEETYAWLGEYPMMREWIGERAIKELEEHGYSIRNRKFETSVAVPRDRIEDDSYGIYAPMMQKMGESAGLWPETLIFQLLLSGFTTKCYDGQSFFATTHPVGKKKVSNRSNKPLTAASYSEARTAMMSLTNDEGVPLNIIPNLLVVPPALEGIARSILKNDLVADGSTTVSNPWKDTAEILVVPQLASKPKAWYLMQNNGVLKPLIWQLRKAPEFQGMVDPNSEIVFKTDKFVYGVNARGNAGFGFWQQAFGSTGE